MELKELGVLTFPRNRTQNRKQKAGNSIEKVVTTAVNEPSEVDLVTGLESESTGLVDSCLGI